MYVGLDWLLAFVSTAYLDIYTQDDLPTVSSMFHQLSTTIAVAS